MSAFCRARDVTSFQGSSSAVVSRYKRREWWSPLLCGDSDHACRSGAVTFVPGDVAFAGIFLSMIRAFLVRSVAGCVTSLSITSKA
jgi:hypothetical protein